MYQITARNAHEALPMGISLLQRQGVREESRAGDVLRFPGPVVTELTRPCERVIFHSWRDANPFFHIVEAAWMLAGRDDLASLTPYVKRMADFSDDGGVTQPGAYGKRWRSHKVREPAHGFPMIGWADQLDWVVRRLRANPNDRRVVVQMWDPWTDIRAAEENGADVPCNLSMIPWVMDGALHLSIFNRSNDIIWGLYGANAVHFSMCLEYLAGRIGLEVGTMTTFSNNFHAYVDKMPSAELPLAAMAHYPWQDDPYVTDPIRPDKFSVEPFSLSEGWNEATVRAELNAFFDFGPSVALETSQWPWLRHVLAPMALAHQRHKGPRLTRREDTLTLLGAVAAADWRLAATEWVERRYG